MGSCCARKSTWEPRSPSGLSMSRSPTQTSVTVPSPEHHYDASNTSGFATHCGFLPCKTSSTPCAASRAMFSRASRVLVAVWGDKIVLGALQSGSSTVTGSLSRASIPAADTVPDSSARTNADSSMIPPRAVLLTQQPGLSRSMRSALIRFFVASMRGTWRERKSALWRTVSRELSMVAGPS